MGEQALDDPGHSVDFGLRTVRVTMGMAAAVVDMS
jgi:hypothetical protein